MRWRSVLNLGVFIVAGALAAAADQQVTLDQLTARIQADAQRRAQGEKIFKDVVIETGRRVVNDLRRHPPKTIPSNELEVFDKMLDIQLQEKRQLWLLSRQTRPAAEKEIERRKIEAKANAAMKVLPRDIVMHPFHSNFDRAWNEFRRLRMDRNFSGGLPGPGHIGDMLKDDPKNPANWTLSAQDKLASGDRDGGRRELDKAIDLGGTATAFALRGALRLEDKDFAGAAEDARKALELDPDDEGTMGLLKSAENRASPRAPTDVAFESARPSPPMGSTSHHAESASLGFSPQAASSVAAYEDARRALLVGDVGKGLSLAKKAIELNPKNAAAHNLMAIIYNRQREYENALTASDQGLALAPSSGELLNNKAFAENRLGRFRDAMITSNLAIESDPNNGWSYANRAHAQGLSGDREAMLADLRRAVEKDQAFRRTLEFAESLVLPVKGDMVFLFPGESLPSVEPAVREQSRGPHVWLVIASGVIGGLLLALGVIPVLRGPAGRTAASVVARWTRRGPAVGPVFIGGERKGELSTGDLIQGQFQILRQIGTGGMGMIYEGTDRSLNRKVAIKRMRDELRENPRERERFLIEARTVASLHHPNIVEIYTISEEGRDVFLVFEFVDGKTVHQHVQKKGRLAPAEAAWITRRVADALTYAHEHGVIHRDMKPANVMITNQGEIKVMDFGVARIVQDMLSRNAATNTVVGTPPYMAPEQEQGLVRKESDTYSLAVCAYEMMTGKLPFIGVGAGMLMNKINMSYVPPSRAIAGLPEALDPVFYKALQAFPERRQRSPREFAAELEQALGGLPARA